MIFDKEKRLQSSDIDLVFNKYEIISEVKCEPNEKNLFANP